MTTSQNLSGSSVNAVTVELVSDSDGTEYQLGKPISFEGRASSITGSITQIALRSPSRIWTNPKGEGPVAFSRIFNSVGIYPCYVQATDEHGNVGKSEMRTFYVVGTGSKGIDLDLRISVMPTSGKVLISASAIIYGDLGQGVRVTKVEFYRNDEKIEEDPHGPYQFTDIIDSQDYRYRAIAILNDGSTLETEAEGTSQEDI